MFDYGFVECGKETREIRGGKRERTNTVHLCAAEAAPLAEVGAEELEAGRVTALDGDVGLAGLNVEVIWRTEKQHVWAGKGVCVGNAVDYFFFSSSSSLRDSAGYAVGGFVCNFTKLVVVVLVVVSFVNWLSGGGFVKGREQFSHE